MKSIKIIRWLSSISMIVVFVFICSFMYSSETKYVFSYNNDNVIYNGNKNNNKVSLMFNVYWGSEYIDDILSVLHKYSAKSTFFLGGTWIESNLDIMLKIYSAGHEIGNHGYLHRDHSKLDYDTNIDEIKSTHNLVKSYINIDMNLFAPPSGSFNSSTIQACKDMDYQVIMWTRDTIDWRDKNHNIIYNRAIDKASGGDLILMHPTEATLISLPMIISYLQSNGYTITTVSDNVFV